MMRTRGSSRNTSPRDLAGFGPTALPPRVQQHFRCRPPHAQWQDRPVMNGAACTESLHDGIPDQWKKLQGLSTTNRELYKRGS